MDDVGLATTVVVVAAIVAWCAYITLRLETLKETGEGAEELLERFDAMESLLEQALGFIAEKVKGIEDIKEYIPSFSINQNPLQSIIDAVVGNWQDSNAAPPAARDESGQFAGEIDGPKEEKTHPEKEPSS